jgi:hypothetical protein
VAFVVVKEKNNPDRMFSLRETEIMIGRDVQALLSLPNVSVSRKHAQLIYDDSGWTVEDLGSQNGTELNGTKLAAGTKTQLNSGDQLRIGKYMLAYFEDARLGLYEGKLVDEIPEYSPFTAKGDGDTTFQMSRAMLEQMKAAARVEEKAVVHLADDSKQAWHPGGKTLIFGGEGGLPVSGLFAKGEVAELTWTGKAHQLRRTALMTKVKVNGKSIQQVELKSGDELLVGKTRYYYRVG